MVLHDGAIAEMKTGEGKTLTGTLAVVLNALAGEGVHVVTVNDYLARRDAEWMSRSTTCSASPSACCRTCSPTRRSAPPTRPTSPTAPTPSSASTTCATTWPTTLEEKVQHGGRIDEDGQPLAMHHFAIVDEVDNILIDEARTPLIISGAPEQAADLYATFAKLAPQMKPGKKPEGMDPRTKKEFVADFDYEFDEKHKTRLGHRAGRRQGREVPRHRPPLPRRERPPRQPPDPVAEGRVALQARRRLRGDRRRGQDHRRVHRPHPRGPPLVGGPAPGGRGQGGRARPGGEPDARDDHAAELLPHVRQARGHDRHGAHRGDRVHEDLQAPASSRSRPTGRWSARTRTTRSTRPRTASGRAVAREIEERHEKGQPVLVGTISVEVSELLSERAAASAASRTRCSTPSPSTPSARARSIAEAGRPGAVTIATNMAGRGVDIKLGGNAEHLTQLELAKLGLQPGDPDYDERFDEILPDDRGARRGRPREGPRGRRPVHLRHRAPRVAPDRQPAARPLRPPGRPRRVALLPLRRGRPRAPVRRRPHLPDPRPPRPDRRGGQGGADRGRRCSRSRSRTPSARSRSRTSSSASASSSTTT